MNPILKLIEQLKDKYGTKFILTVLVEAAFYDALTSDLVEPWIAVVCMTAVAVAYFITRSVQETSGNLNPSTEEQK